MLLSLQALPCPENSQQGKEEVHYIEIKGYRGGYVLIIVKTLNQVVSVVDDEGRE